MTIGDKGYLQESNTRVQPKQAELIAINEGKITKHYIFQYVGVGYKISLTQEEIDLGFWVFSDSKKAITRPRRRYVGRAKPQDLAVNNYTSSKHQRGGIPF